MNSIIVHSGEWDRIYHAFNIATVYSSMGEETIVFLTYWALKTILEENNIDCGDIEKNKIIQNGLVSGKIKRLKDVIELGKKFGRLKIIACSATLELLGIDKNQLPDWVDKVGGLTEVLGVDNVIFI